MAAAAILNFNKNMILGTIDGRMTNIYLCTKFDANMCIWDKDVDMAEKSNPEFFVVCALVV